MHAARRFLYTRALLSTDGPGLNYVRRQIQKRRVEVQEGRLGIYYDESCVAQEVGGGTCLRHLVRVSG